MDAAYSAPFHTSAAAWPADREYLTWNPDNQMATYEYKTAWMIAPGCKIDSYTVDLACVTDYEINNFDGVSCARDKIGQGDDALSDGCDCSAMYANSKTDQSKPGPTSVVYNGRFLAQGQFEDKSMHTVREAPYRYDHVKIRLNVNNPKLAEECFTKESMINQRTAIFYSPISDATITDIMACRFDQSTGTFVCDQGKLLWDLRGRASFGKIDYEDEIFMGDSVRVEKIPITIQGKKQCIYAELRNSYQEVIAQEFKPYFPNKDDPSKAELVEEIDLMILNRITAEHFGKFADRVIVSSAATAADYGAHQTRIQKEDGLIQTGTYNVYFKDEVDDNYDYGTHIKIGDDGVWEELQPQIYHVPENGMAFTFQRPKVPAASKCAGEASPCKKYIFRITKGQPRTVDKAQQWTLHLELRHAPGESNQGSCADSTDRDMITSQGRNMEENLKITAHPYTREQRQICRYRSGLKANKEGECDCDADGTSGDCTGDTDEDGYIKDDEKAYCYSKAGAYSCHTYPKCFTGAISNTKDCDCNMNDILDDECKDKYCWSDGVCRGSSEAVKQIPKIIRVEYSYLLKTGGTLTREVRQLETAEIDIETIQTGAGLIFKVYTTDVDSLDVDYSGVKLAATKSKDTWTTSQLFKPEKQNYNFQIRAEGKDTKEISAINFVIKGK